MKISFISLCFLPIMAFTQEKTKWNLFISNDLNDKIPARIYFEDVNNESILNIVNANETISLKPKKISNDTVYYQFIDYNAEICFTKEKEDLLTGYWINHENLPATKRKVEARLADNFQIENEQIKSISGNWNAKIIRETSESPAILMLEENQATLTGTIRTKTGDYRFLEGQVSPDQSFYLSSFNGNSIFYLKGKISNENIDGTITALKTNSIKFSAFKDDQIAFEDPKTLTKVVNDKPFELNLPNENGKLQNFKELTKNKVTIVSVFGTWCHNCVDEVNYFKELQKKFPDLKIVCVAFEATDDLLEQQKRVAGFKNRKEISFDFLIAGRNKAENVLTKFPMIDSFKSYPTTFIIDQKGKIQEIHTGFNGPATGIFYDQFKEEFERSIRNLYK